MPDRQGKRVTDHRSDILKGSIPRAFLAILGTRKTRMFEAERREREGENSKMKQLREVWRSCTRDSAEADDSCFALIPTADW